MFVCPYIKENLDLVCLLVLIRKYFILFLIYFIWCNERPFSVHIVKNYNAIRLTSVDNMLAITTFI